MLNDEEPPETPTPNEPGTATATTGAQYVGDSDSRGGEEISARDGKEAGREDAGTQGKTERPVGTSSARDTNSVDPQEPITGSPPMGGTGGH